MLTAPYPDIATLVATAANDRDEEAADILAKLLRAPSELGGAGASAAAILAAEEIARTAALLLAGKALHSDCQHFRLTFVP